MADWKEKLNKTLALKGRTRILLQVYECYVGRIEEIKERNRVQRGGAGNA